MSQEKNMNRVVLGIPEKTLLLPLRSKGEQMGGDTVFPPGRPAARRPEGRIEDNDT